MRPLLFYSTSSPRECRLVGGRLGDLLARRREWDEAARAFRDAVEAAELTFHGRLDPAARELERDGQETLRVGPRSDSLQRATTWLPHWFSKQAARVSYASGWDSASWSKPGWRNSQMSCQCLQRRNGAAGYYGVGDPAAGASRQLQEVLAAIRTLPGYSDFATGARDEDIASAVEANWPVLYVNPTPYGTLLLLITAGDEGATVSASFLEHPTSLEVLFRLLAGDAAESPELMETIEFGSYLAGASGFGDQERDVQTDVEHVLPWIGEALGRPIRDSLAAIGARGVTLIPCGPIGLAPLHAAPWSDDDQPNYLVDEFDIRYAPSAVLAAACLRRGAARAHSRPTLVALANPDGTLRAAESEVEEIRHYFNVGQVTQAVGEDASSTFLERHAAEATHLHLACHARAGLFDAEDTGFSLSDGLVPAHEVAQLDLSHA